MDGYRSCGYFIPDASHQNPGNTGLRTQYLLHQLLQPLQPRIPNPPRMPRQLKRKRRNMKRRRHARLRTGDGGLINAGAQGSELAGGQPMDLGLLHHRLRRAVTRRRQHRTADGLGEIGRAHV